MTKTLQKHQEPQLPALQTMFEADAGAGFEAADKDSYAIPFLTVLQALSPQLNKQQAEYIKGAEQGQILDTASQAVADAVTVIPCYFKRSFTHWKPRGQGGGFLGEFPVTDPIVAKAQRGDKGGLECEDGTILNDTRSHYVLVVHADGSTSPAVISMTSTQIRKSKAWMTRMQQLRMQRADGSLFAPPMFAHSYELASQPESNDQGSWYGWKIGEASPVVNPDHYAMAKAFRDAVAEGQAKAQHAAAAGGTDDDDDIAF